VEEVLVQGMEICFFGQFLGGCWRACWVLNGVEEDGKIFSERTWRENEFGAASVEHCFIRKIEKSKCTSFCHYSRRNRQSGMTYLFHCSVRESMKETSV
jgi:hypothetical protein